MDQNGTYPFVSVVMPLYNEAAYIGKCIDSLLGQTYPRDRMEWIFVDGMSADDTVGILSQYKERYPDLICVLHNPNKIVPYAMNIGIRASKGKYIIRLDAHAEYAENYIEKCVELLETTDAENVGGVAETRAKSFTGNCIAKMLSSKFGVGNAAFRTGGTTGYVDTVPFGAFRREVFSEYGGYDERLVRNQDNEMNYRIRKNGGKILLSDEIRFAYYCRETIKGISKMAFTNGTWNVITMRLCPGSMGLRHFVPLAFVLSLIVLPVLGSVFPLFWYVLSAELALYLALDTVFSARQAAGMKEFGLLMLLFPVFHICYGAGAFNGIIKLLSGKYRKTDYSAPKL